ncbi:MAG: PD40 domain-containing protein, partial [Acidobacteriaceae bacterium]|nr:PD40 domain-containing protein [Acidobacteriaceae bacterium]
AGFTHFWKRELANSSTSVLIEPVPGEVSYLDFTRNGTEVVFANSAPLEKFNRRVYKVPLTGGAVQQVRGEFSGPVGVSRDGHWAATVRANRAANRDELWIVDLEQREGRMITSRAYPERLSWDATPAWSADGKLVAFPVEERDRQGFLIGVYVINVETGKLHRIPSPRWLWLERLAWAGQKPGLAVVAREQDSSVQQIWYVPYPQGRAVRLANDIDNYVGASFTSDGSQLASVQVRTLSNIYVLQPGNLNTPIQVTPGSGRYFDLSWTHDGRLLYASDSNGSADIYVMNSDGTAQGQITSGGLNWAPVSSPDGKYIAFHSNRNGNWNIWRADAAGGNQIPLTKGPHDSNWPRFTADGNSVVYHQADLKGFWSIWKTPLNGGPATPVTRVMTMRPAVSPRDDAIAAWYSETVENPHWKLAVFGHDGGTPVKVFNLGVPIASDSQLCWTPEGDAITFLAQRNGVWNLWKQPVDGRPAWQLTSLSSGQIYSFDWARDGRLAYSHGSDTNDVVLVRDEANAK